MRGIERRLERLERAAAPRCDACGNAPAWIVGTDRERRDIRTSNLLSDRCPECMLVPSVTVEMVGVDVGLL